MLCGPNPLAVPVVRLRPQRTGKIKNKKTSPYHTAAPSRFSAVAPLTPNMAWHAWQQSHPLIQSFILLESSTGACKPNATIPPETNNFSDNKKGTRKKQGFRVRTENLGYGTGTRVLAQSHTGSTITYHLTQKPVFKINVLYSVMSRHSLNGHCLRPVHCLCLIVVLTFSSMPNWQWWHIAKHFRIEITLQPQS